MTNIFDTLVNNNVFLSHNKFQLHKKHSISYFANISSRITLRDSLRGKLEETLMCIDLEDEEIKQILHDNKDKYRDTRIWYIQQENRWK